MSELRQLVLYVSPAWKRDLLHVPLLYPFWGNALSKEKTPFQWQLFEKYGFDTAYYRVTEDIEEADMILMPYSHNHVVLYAPDILDLCQEASCASGKPLLIDGIGDIERPVSVPNSIVIRYGGYRFLKQGNEIHIPPYADDLLELYCGGELQLRHVQPKASISFAGWAQLTLKQELRVLIKEAPNRLHAIFDSRYGACKKGVFFRREAVELLTRSTLVDSSILVRNAYSGHRDTAQKSAEDLRKDFVDNLLGSDFALDVRGDANASIRLFEILSLGRVPVILDTERNLPFSDRVDYSTFALIVDFRDRAQLPQIIADFNNTLTDEKFIQMQKAARDAYRNYFRVDALTAPLVREIWAKLASL